MGTPGNFDIQSLLSFSPARYLCETCYALYVDLPITWHSDEHTHTLRCAICGTDYLDSETIPVRKARAYFEIQGLQIQFRDSIAHSKALATIARSMRAYSSQRVGDTPMIGLLRSLLAAEKFIHFTTYGMSLQLVGALRMASLRVPVRGVIANAGPAIVEELRTYAHESPNLQTRIYERSDNPTDWHNMPHQKVIVIDGLLAFKGSANLTVEGWRKAARDLDSVEVVTDVGEVIDLNNRLFSKVWPDKDASRTIIMTDDIPF